MERFHPTIFSCENCNLQYKKHLPPGTKYSSCKRCGTLIDIETQENEQRYKRKRQLHNNNYQRHINEINNPFQFDLYQELNNNIFDNDDPYNFDNYSGHDDYYRILGINDNNNEEIENEDFYYNNNNNNNRNNNRNNNHFFQERNNRIIQNLQRRNNNRRNNNNNINNINRLNNNFNNRFSINNFNNGMFNINIPNDEYNRNSGLRHASAFFDFSDNDEDEEEINLDEYFESAERLLNDLNIDIQTLGTKIIKEKPKLKKVKMNKKLYIKNDKGKLEIPQCCICLNNMKVNEEVVKLKCKHLFHFKCLDKWIENKQVCPFCRSEINNDDSKKENQKNKKK